LPAIDFVLEPTFGQLLIREAPPGTTIGVVANAPDGPAATVIVDSQGMALLRDLPSGAADTYLVEAGQAVAKGPTTQLPDTTPPPQPFYDGQQLLPGYGYLETRDGTTLSVFVTLPGSPANGPYPTLVEYSGYSPSNPALDEPSRVLLPTLGYALVQVNVRGTGCSGGSFDAFEPIQNLDGYDVIEIVAAQSWSAKVGMWGVSYPGIMQLHVAATQPPSLAAVAPLSPLDRIESVLYPGGVFNEGFGLEWAVEVNDRAAAFGQSWTRALSAVGDATCQANQSLRRFNPDVVERLATSTDRSPLWESRSAEPTAADINVPVFIAGAWQDEQTGGRFPALLDDLVSAPVLRASLYNGLHTDPLGPDVLSRVLEFYDFYVREQLPDIDPVTRFGIEIALASVFGGTVRLEPNRFEGQAYAAALETYEAEQPIRVLFEVGAQRPNLPQASWAAAFDAWPIPEAEGRRWFLDGSSALGDRPPSTETAGTFVTDPAEGQRITATDLNTLWTNRPGWDWRPTTDANRLTYTSAPLDETLVAIGTASVDLWVSSGSTDAVIEASLSELAPDGTETLIQVGWLKLSRRALADDSTSLRPIPTLAAADAAPLIPGVAVEARIEILPFAHVLRPGSRLRLTIDSPGGNSARWKFATEPSPIDITVLHGPENPSSVVLPIIPGLSAPPERPTCGSLRGQPCRPLP
jgi:predicted acyl esterase